MRNNGNKVKQLLITIALLLPLTVSAADPKKSNTIKIAVIDTGFDFDSKWEKYKDIPKPILCAEGHKSFVLGNDKLNDSHGHGTHIAGTIAKHAAGQDYCLLILKNYDDHFVFNDTLKSEINALKYAIEQDVDMINYSGGGIDYSTTECRLIKKALDKGIIIVVAAGNEKNDLEKTPYYPAMCDPRVIAVTNMRLALEPLTEEEQKISKKEKYRQIRKITESSNFGDTSKTTLFNEFGTNVKSTLPKDQVGEMTGTSQATAVVTGKMVKIVRMMKSRYQIKENQKKK